MKQVVLVISLDVYQLLMKEGYKDLEEKKPPRKTCQHNVRVDYILCSKDLFETIDEYQLQIVPSGSDHKCLKGTLPSK